MINKKEMLIIIFLCSISVFLIGCDNPAAKKAAEELQGNITIWCSPEKKDLIVYEKNKFTQKNKKVTITVLSIDKDKIYDKLSQDLKANIKHPDIVEINDNYISGIANKYGEKLTELNSSLPSIKNDFLTSKQSQVIIKGKTLAIPWDTHPIAIFYRKDIFLNVGIDVNTIKTYAEYINAGKLILQATSGKSKIFAIKSTGDNYLFRIFLSQLRESYFDKDGKCIVASDKSLRAIKMVKSIYDLGIAYSYADDSTLIKGINNGTIVSAAYDNSLASNLIKESSALNGKWGVINLPAFEAGGNRNAQIDGSSLIIPKNSIKASTDTAVEFAKYITTDNEALDYETSSLGVIPSYTPIYTDKVFDTAIDFFGGAKIYKTFAQIIQNSDIGSSTTTLSPRYKEVDDEVIKACNNIIFKDGDAKILMTQIENEFNK